MAIRRIRGRYVCGVIELDEPLDFEDGTGIDMLVEEPPGVSSLEPDPQFERSVLEHLSSTGASGEPTIAVLSPERAAEVAREANR
ncbi:MAG: hypothetical protein F4X26_04920 [Chloroflexi bacterium]|nr:hypothetical protein [Chloroflexota bacterium]